VSSKNNTNRSPVRDATVAAPLAVGAYYTGRNFWNSTDRRVTDAVEVGRKAPSVIENLSYVAQGQFRDDLRVSQFIDEFASTARGVDAANVNFAWERASASLPPELRDTFLSMRSSSPVGDMVSFLGQDLQRMDMSYRNTFMQSLESNLGFAKNLSEADLMRYAPVTPTFAERAFLETPVSSIGSLPENLRATATSIQNSLGFEIRGTYRERADWAGMGEHKLWLGKNVSVALPVTVDGQILTGSELSTRRLAGSFTIWDEATKTSQEMQADQYLLHRIEKDIVPRMKSGELTSSQDVQNAINELRSGILGNMETTPAMPPSLESRSLKGYSRLHSSYTQLVDPSGNAIPLSEAIKTPGLRERVGREYFPSSASQMQAGKATTVDLSEMFRAPQSAPQQRILAKTFKPLGVAETAMGLNKEWEWLQSKQFTEFFGDHPGVFADTVFLKEGDMSAARAAFGSGEFEASADFLKRARANRDITPSVSTLSREISEFFDQGGNLIPKSVSLPKGTLLGWDERSNPITLHNEAKLKGISQANGKYALYMHETIEESQPKMFLSKMRALPSEHIPRGLDARMEAGILGKEVHIANMQQTSQLFKFMQANAENVEERMGVAMTRARGIDSMLRQGKVAPELRNAYKAERDYLRSTAREVLKFVQNPGERMDALAAKAVDHTGAFQQSRYTASLMDMGILSGMSDRQLGEAFGGAPEVLGDNWLEQVKAGGLKSGITSSQVESINKISPRGMVFMTAGGPRSERFKINAPASIEPRFFTLLESGTYGDVGKGLSAEFARRAIADNPEANQASRALVDSLASFAGESRVESAQRFRLEGKFNKEAFTEFMRKGGALEVGAGRPDVYVPGMETVRAMIPYVTPEGQKTFNSLQKTYMDLARQASKVKAGELAPEEFLSTALGEGGVAEGGYWKAAQDLQKLQAPFSKESAIPLFRSSSQRVAGSRTLEISSRVGAMTGDKLAEIAGRRTFVAGISDEVFNQMISSSLKAGVMQSSEAEEMTARWMEKGTAMGAAWRHPGIGQYSAQPMRLHRITGGNKDPFIVMPEGTSALLGFAADKDADTAGLMLLHGDLGTKAESLIDDASFVANYEKHASMMKTLKPKSQKIAAQLEKVAREDAARVAVEQISMPESFLPRVSTTMYGFKQALSASSDLPDNVKSAAMTFLEAAEQNPLAGKHWEASKIAGELKGNRRGFEPYFESMLSAFRKGDAVSAKHSFLESLGGREAVAGNQKIQQALGSSGLNLDETLDYMMGAWRKYANTEDARMANLVMGRGAPMKPAELPQYLEAMKRTAVSGAAGSSGPGVAAKASAAVLGQINRVAASGKGLLKYAKPVAIGAGVALGLAAILDPPLRTVGPAASFSGGDAQRAMSPQQRTSSRTPESLEPPVGVQGGAPSAPSRLIAPTARIKPPTAYKTHIQYSSRDAIQDPVAIAKECASIAGNTSSVNLSIQDGRSILNVDQILNDLE
jgi:hypothetical protein